MSLKKKQQRIDELLAELRELQVPLRSDWHAAFEALLRIDMHPYGDAVKIIAEKEIGAGPPRADFLEIVDTGSVTFSKEIFRIFRRFNVIEYKNPRDSLNERVLRKVVGYANMFIASAGHEGDVPPDQVTISIFKATGNTRLFRRLRAAGMLHDTQTPGIYRLTGFTDIPFQIVITGELEGEEYAAYRALTDRAEEADMLSLINNAKETSDDYVREHYNSVINLVLVKNPDYADDFRRDEAMEDILMDIVKDRVDERVNSAVTEAVADAVNNNTRETKLYDIKSVMDSFGVNIDRAMESLKIPQEQRSTYAELVQKSMQA